MFVLTEDSEILNLAQCLKIVVERNDIYAYTSVSDSLRNKNLVARFETEADAGYVCFELFKALKAGKRAWDPETIKPLRALWDKVGKNFDNNDVPNGLTTRAHISAFDFDTVTITYDSQVNRHQSKKTTTAQQKRVARKLKELLGDTHIEVEWTS